MAGTGIPSPVVFANPYAYVSTYDIRHACRLIGASRPLCEQRLGDSPHCRPRLHLRDDSVGINRHRAGAAGAHGNLYSSRRCDHSSGDHRLTGCTRQAGCFANDRHCRANRITGHRSDQSGVCLGGVAGRRWAQGWFHGYAIRVLRRIDVACRNT